MKGYQPEVGERVRVVECCVSDSRHVGMEGTWEHHPVSDKLLVRLGVDDLCTPTEVEPVDPPVTTPQVGRTYDITARVTTRFVDSRGMELGHGSETIALTPLEASLFTWVEVQPEYVVGALYVDADGETLERTPNGWRKYRNGEFYTEGYASLPVERVYRESEAR